MRSRILTVGIALVLTACGGTAGATPDASPAATSTAPSATTAPAAPSTTLAASPEATPAETLASPTATPPHPALAVAFMVRPTVEGLRVRAVPGSTGELVSTMPLDALGMVELGPLTVDGFDWYLVRYSFLNASGVTDGAVGWVASGPSTSPWLAPVDDAGWYSGIFAAGAGAGPGALGPVEIGDSQGVRWAAVGEACPLVVSLGDVAIVSTTVDGFAEGEVFLFRDYPELAGMVDIDVESECSWALSALTYQG